MKTRTKLRVLLDCLYVTFMASAILCIPAQAASKYGLELLSENPSGPNNANAGLPFISSDGRFAVFKGAALVPQDSSGLAQVYLYDRDTDIVELISVATDGGGANREVFLPNYAGARVVSADGRYVVFRTQATNLQGSTNASNLHHIWLRDRMNATTSLISADSAGVEANSHSTDFSIAPDGWGVIFNSGASNLDDLDPDGFTNTFLHQLSDRSTKLSCFDKNGAKSSQCLEPSLSCNGIMVFWSGNADMAPDDLHFGGDLFFGNPLAGNNVRISIPPQGDLADNIVNYTSPSVSCDGQRIIFGTLRVLSAADTNTDWDLYVYDLDIGEPRIFLSPDDVSLEPSEVSISANGEWISYAGTGHIDPSDSNNASDVYSFSYSRDRSSRGPIRLVSQNIEAAEIGNASSRFTAVADNGVVVFESSSTNLITGTQVNGGTDIFADAYELIMASGFEP